MDKQTRSLAERWVLSTLNQEVKFTHGSFPFSTHISLFDVCLRAIKLASGLAWGYRSSAVEKRSGLFELLDEKWLIDYLTVQFSHLRTCRFVLQFITDSQSISPYISQLSMLYADLTMILSKMDFDGSRNGECNGSFHRLLGRKPCRRRWKRIQIADVNPRYRAAGDPFRPEGTWARYLAFKTVAVDRFCMVLWFSS